MVFLTIFTVQLRNCIEVTVRENESKIDKHSTVSSHTKIALRKQPMNVLISSIYLIWPCQRQIEAIKNIDKQKHLIIYNALQHRTISCCMLTYMMLKKLLARCYKLA